MELSRMELMLYKAPYTLEDGWETALEGNGDLLN